VRGGVLHGTFPELRIGGPDCVSARCPTLPSSPWEQIWKPLAKWLGVEDSYLSAVLPNVGRFPALSNLTATDYFL